MAEKYIIDGKEYERYEDIPAKDRALLDAKLRFFEDRDGDGTPDILQAFSHGGKEFTITKRNAFTTEILGNGKDRVIKTSTLDSDRDDNHDISKLIERARAGKSKSQSTRSYFDKLVIAFLILVVTLLLLDKFKLLPQL